MNYERRFSELIRLVPLIAENEEQKCKRFIAGLHSRLRVHLTQAPRTHYGELVDAAMRVEREVPTPTSGSRSEGKRVGPNTSQGGPSQSQSTKKRGRFRWYSGKRLGRGATSSSQGSVRSPAGPSGSRDTQSTVLECSTCGK